MLFKKLIYSKTLNRTKQFIQISNINYLSTKLDEEAKKVKHVDNILLEKIEKKTVSTKKKKGVNYALIKHIEDLNKFFANNPKCAVYKPTLPKAIMESRPYNNPENLYLICPDIAKKIAKEIVNRVNKNDTIIAETNAGLGLISQELLHEEGIQTLRIYEGNKEFQQHLEDLFGNDNPDVKLFKKDFFRLGKYAYIDNFDKGNRASTLLEGIPTKDWKEVDPNLTIIGTLTKKGFFKYLLKSLILQNEGVVKLGRLELFLITYHDFWDSFSNKKAGRSSKIWILLFGMFFDFELISQYPREYFLPWELKMTKFKDKPDKNLNHLCLVKFTMKKELEIDPEHFKAFYCFAYHVYGRGTSSIIAACEKWVPGSGEALLLPKLEHKNYYEELSVFTKFRELNFEQNLAIFKELSNLSNYKESLFIEMVEQDLVKSETISTDMNDSQKK